MTRTTRLVTGGALAAFFTALGVTGTAIFNNWDHIFGHSSQSAQSVNANGARDVTSNSINITSGASANGHIFQDVHGNINIGKEGSEFYKDNGIRLSMPVVLRSAKRGAPGARIHVGASNESDRPIRHFQFLIFDAKGTPGSLVMKSPEVSIGRKERTPPWMFNVSSAPDNVLLCFSYDAKLPGKFVTSTAPAKKDAAVEGYLSGDRYRTTGDWAVFYSDRLADCYQNGKIEPIPTKDFFE